MHKGTEGGVPYAMSLVLPARLNVCVKNMPDFRRAAIPLDELGPDGFEMARKRHAGPDMQRSLRAVADELSLSDDDNPVDFSAAGLYLVGLQTVLATLACAAVSVACCWLLPEAAISAVRTLAVTATVGFLAVRKPFRLGRVRGVITMFNALRPCVVLYILCLTLEQLVHTCVPTGEQVHAVWRRVVFHLMVALMLLSGFIRAYRPRSETDFPFLLTATALLVVAILPPPASALSGPLCEPIPLFAAGERLLRALLFSGLYVVHVYSGSPNRNALNELSLVVMRCSAASIWVLGVHPLALALAPVQAILSLWARFGTDEGGGGGHGGATGLPTYASVDTRSDGGGSTTTFEDPEAGAMSVYHGAHVLVSPTCLSGYTAYGEHDTRIQMCGKERASPNALSECHSNGGDDHAQSVDPDVLSAIASAPSLRVDSARRPANGGLSFNLGSVPTGRSSTVSSERLAEVAARM